MVTFRKIALTESSMKVLSEAMVRVLIWDKETDKKPTERVLPSEHAHKLGKNGDNYKLQILGDKDQIDFEYKSGTLV